MTMQNYAAMIDLVSGCEYMNLNDDIYRTMTRYIPLQEKSQWPSLFRASEYSRMDRSIFLSLSVFCNITTYDSVIITVSICFKNFNYSYHILLNPS